MSYLSIDSRVYDFGGKLFVSTLEDFDCRPYGLNVVVPRGYVSDGMSVPRFLWRLCGPRIGGMTLGPSVVHDYLYKCKKVSRALADSWYRKALVWNGYPLLIAWIVWAGLRLFGWTHW